MSLQLCYFWSTGRGTYHHEFNDHTDLCVNAQDTITGARVGHKRPSVSCSFSIASHEFMSFYDKWHMIKTRDK